MNYEENTVDWQIGDLVIHDADRKESGMLMVVIGRDEEKGLIKSVLIDQDRHHDLTIYENEKKYLHDPKRFDIGSKRHLPKGADKIDLKKDAKEGLKLELRSVDEAIAWLQGPEGEVKRKELLKLRWKIRVALDWCSIDNPKPPIFRQPKGSE